MHKQQRYHTTNFFLQIILENSPTNLHLLSKRASLQEIAPKPKNIASMESIL